MLHQVCPPWILIQSFSLQFSFVFLFFYPFSIWYIVIDVQMFNVIYLQVALVALVQCLNTDNVNKKLNKYRKHNLYIYIFLIIINIKWITICFHQTWNIHFRILRVLRQCSIYICVQRKPTSAWLHCHHSFLSILIYMLDSSLTTFTRRGGHILPLYVHLKRHSAVTALVIQ